MIGEKTFSIDHMATGLEKGLGNIELLRYIPEDLRLRTSVCAIASTAIARHLAQRNIRSELVASFPRLPIDPTMSHIFVHAEIGGESKIIDPTYSQFLGYVGLSHAYVSHTMHDIYPEEKIAVSPSIDYSSIVRSLVDTSISFQETKREVEGKFLFRLGHGPLEDADAIELAKTFQSIWSLRNQVAYVPGRDVRNVGAMLADEIEVAYLTD